MGRELYGNMVQVAVVLAAALTSKRGSMYMSHHFFGSLRDLGVMAGDREVCYLARYLVGMQIYCYTALNTLLQAAVRAGCWCFFMVVPQGAHWPLPPVSPLASVCVSNAKESGQTRENA